METPPQQSLMAPEHTSHDVGRPCFPHDCLHKSLAVFLFCFDNSKRPLPNDGHEGKAGGEERVEVTPSADVLWAMEICSLFLEDSLSIPHFAHFHHRKRQQLLVASPQRPIVSTSTRNTPSKSRATAEGRPLPRVSSLRDLQRHNFSVDDAIVENSALLLGVPNRQDETFQQQFVSRHHHQRQFAQMTTIFSAKESANSTNPQQGEKLSSIGDVCLLKADGYSGKNLVLLISDPVSHVIFSALLPSFCNYNPNKVRGSSSPNLRRFAGRFGEKGYYDAVDQLQHYMPNPYAKIHAQSLVDRGYGNEVLEEYDSEGEFQGRESEENEQDDGQGKGRTHKQKIDLDSLWMRHTLSLKRKAIRMNAPWGMVQSNDQLFVVERGNKIVRSINIQNGRVQTVAGKICSNGVNSSGIRDGRFEDCLFEDPTLIASNEGEALSQVHPKSSPLQLYVADVESKSSSIVVRILNFATRTVSTALVGEKGLALTKMVECLHVTKGDRGQILLIASVKSKMTNQQNAHYCSSTTGFTSDQPELFALTISPSSAFLHDGKAHHLGYHQSGVFQQVNSLQESLLESGDTLTDSTTDSASVSSSDGSSSLHSAGGADGARGSASRSRRGRRLIPARRRPAQVGPGQAGSATGGGIGQQPMNHCVLRHSQTIGFVNMSRAAKILTLSSDGASGGTSHPSLLLSALQESVHQSKSNKGQGQCHGVTHHRLIPQLLLDVSEDMFDYSTVIPKSTTGGKSIKRNGATIRAVSSAAAPNSTSVATSLSVGAAGRLRMRSESSSDVRVFSQQDDHASRGTYLRGSGLRPSQVAKAMSDARLASVKKKQQQRRLQGQGGGAASTTIPRLSVHSRLLELPTGCPLKSRSCVVGWTTVVVSQSSSSPPPVAGPSNHQQQQQQRLDEELGGIVGGGKVVGLAFYCQTDEDHSYCLACTK